MCRSAFEQLGTARRPFLTIILPFLFVCGYAFSVFSGAFSHNFPEDPAEAFGIGKAGLLGDLFDGIVGLPQQRAGDLDPVAVEGVVEGVAGNIFKDLAEIAFAVSAGCAYIFNVKRFVVVVVYFLERYIYVFNIGHFLIFSSIIIDITSYLQKQSADFIKIALNKQLL